ncbi:hypothetical protein PMAYCL1PPCAC_09381 [Pristionchus mayeri]|uniref:N-acetyltransferase domain-containing protein n=1 Tax=Pristionchus mayeri TaxID=1317129 RepID=A0AAN5CEU0_9BILA|nr:hypothetical protein PMAYCL1PPCAC_09381 [Pristionchus mayeri]
MTLHEFNTTEELKELLDHELWIDTQLDLPSTSPIDSVLRIEIGNEFPLSRLDVLGYSTECPEYVYCMETCDVQHPYVYVRAPAKHDGKLLNESVRLVLEQYRQQILDHGRLMVSADEVIVDAFRSLIAEVLGRSCKVIVDHEVGMFYMTAAQREELLSTELEILCGYTVEPVDVDRDGDTIHALWKNGISAEITKERLRRFPSTCVRDSSGQLVGWAMSGRFGQISNEFVLPEHRGKGLGKAVELALAKALARKGRRVFKYVEMTNEIVLASSMRSPHWTLWREDGKRKAMFFRKFEIVM